MDKALLRDEIDRAQRHYHDECFAADEALTETTQRKHEDRAAAWDAISDVLAALLAKAEEVG